MRACRQSCIDEVQRKVAAGFTFDKVRELIQHPPKGVGLGEYLEGQEQEPLLDENESAWVKGAANMDIQAAKDMEFKLLCEEDVGEASGTLVVQQPGEDAHDSPTAVADVRVAAPPPRRARGSRQPREGRPPPAQRL